MTCVRLVKNVVLVVLLCVILLSAFGQEPLTTPRRPTTGAPPRVMMNPMVLRRAYDDLTREQSQIDSILSRIDETRDARLAETLRMQQTMLSEQLADIIEQLQQQGLELPTTVSQTALPDKPTAPGQTSDAVLPTALPDKLSVPPAPSGVTARQTIPTQPNQPGMYFPMAPDGTAPSPFSAPDIFLNTAPAAQQRATDEIASLQRSVESLRGEVAALRNDIANLVAMVQILTRSLAQPSLTTQPSDPAR